MTRPALLLLLSACQHTPPTPPAPAAGGLPQADSPWFRDGQAALQARLQAPPPTDRARNVILFVGDGMGISTVTAARIYAGQRAGQPGEGHHLAFETLPHVALARTYSADAQVPDSAATMSALVTGVKTRSGVLSVQDSVPLGDCAAARLAPARTLLEQAEAAGLSTGIVTTARVTHATPAALYAHSADRDWEADGDLPPEARAAGCTDIAAQLLQPVSGDGPEVVLGGGRRMFLPQTAPDPLLPGVTGARQDGRDLTAEWKAARPDGTVVWSRTQLLAAPVGGPLLGLLAPSHMAWDHARQATDEPSLAELTAAALDRLDRPDGPGFFLMVEGGRIDHAHHDGRAGIALSETAALSEAVALARSRTRADETLIIVTADHSHVLTVSGYPRRGNDILGVVQEPDGSIPEARDGQPYTTLGYANGPGAPEAGQPRPDPTGLAWDDRQQALVPLRGETHGGEDVAVFAGGPAAHLLSGAVEQNYLYHVMAYALRL